MSDAKERAPVSRSVMYKIITRYHLKTGRSFHKSHLETGGTNSASEMKTLEESDV